jgi:hypothetical protein
VPVEPVEPLEPDEPVLPDEPDVPVLPVEPEDEPVLVQAGHAQYEVLRQPRPPQSLDASQESGTSQYLVVWPEGASQVPLWHWLPAVHTEQPGRSVVPVLPLLPPLELEAPVEPVELPEPVEPVEPVVTGELQSQSPDPLQLKRPSQSAGLAQEKVEEHLPWMVSQ